MHRAKELSGLQKPAKILLADSSPNRLRLVEELLLQAGYELLLAEDGEEVLRRSFEDSPDLVVLGVRLSAESSLEVCRRFPGSRRFLIMLLLDSQDEASIVRALESGANDAVVNPLRRGEFLARVRALLRCRAQAVGTAEQVMKVGDLSVDLSRHQVQKNGNGIELTRTEFGLFTYLVRNRDSVVTMDDLAENVWGVQGRPLPATIRVHIGKIRQKLEPPECISTEWGRGYRFWSRDD